MYPLVLPMSRSQTGPFLNAETPPTILVITFMDGPDIAHAVYMILMPGTSSRTSLSTSSSAAGPSNRREFRALVLTCPRISQGSDQHSERP